jgi:prepilin-type N-terminal cleavage/methylation domain-containing protein
MTMRPRSTRPGNRSGFTLIEVVVVLLVLSATVALTLPAFLEPPADDDMTVATRRVESLFRLARDSAARGGRRVSVVIDSATSRVWLDVPGVFAPDTNRTTTLRGSAGPAGEDLELPRGVRLQLSTTRATFTFAPSGAAFADSLRLVTSLGSRVITIHPWTGDVHAH